MQKRLVKQWMGCARLIYNEVVADRQRFIFGSEQHYRQLYQERREDGEQWSFMQGVPVNILDESIRVSFVPTATCPILTPKIGGGRESLDGRPEEQAGKGGRSASD